MSAEAIPNDDGVRVDVETTPNIRELASHVGEYLNDDGRCQMNAEMGEALLKSIATGNDAYVNRVVEGWVRTLLLKVHGTDEILDSQTAPDSEEPVSIEELRTRFR